MRKCVTCGIPGHNKRTCTVTPVVTPVVTKDASWYHCGACGGNGHNIRTCSRTATAPAPTVNVVTVETVPEPTLTVTEATVPEPTVPEQVAEIQDLLAETTRVYKNMDVYHETNKELDSLYNGLKPLSDRVLHSVHNRPQGRKYFPVRDKCVEQAIRACLQAIQEARSSAARWEACRA